MIFQFMTTIAVTLNVKLLRLRTETSTIALRRLADKSVTAQP